MMQNIKRTDFNELNMLLWDRHNTFIDPKTAFELYEKRWGYVDQSKLTVKEKTLITDLVNTFGNGHFMPATY